MKIHWRPATAADLPRIRELNAELEERLGRGIDLPDITRPPVLLCMVAERDGRVIGGWLCECVAELQFFGTSPWVTASARRMTRWFHRLVRATGIRWVFCNIPPDADETIGPALVRAGFEKQSLMPYALLAGSEETGEKP